MTDEFSRFHPAVNFIFYVLVLVMTMFQMQIGFIIITFVCACMYHLYLKKRSGLKYLKIVIFVFIASAIINPLFSHRGATLLFYLFTQNPVTLESLIYGLATAGIIAAMLLWFSTFNIIMTGDKLLAGIGKVMPHVATFLSMIFRFVPKYTKQAKAVLQANKALGAPTVGIKNKIKTQAQVFSITTTWALENSVDTADSMRARGYGIGKRTSYNNYRIQKRDVTVILYMVLLFVFLCLEITMGRVETYYYPIVRIKGTVVAYTAYTMLCMTPIIINVMEEIRWRRLRSKI